MNGREWNHRHVEANGINIHYVRHGKGNPLVLLHGWPEFWYTWHKNNPVLAESFDVVAPDLRGFGGTDRPRGPAVELLGDLLEDLRALVDPLGSAAQFIATIPEILWEASLGIWLTVKGFNPSVAGSEKFKLEAA